MSICDAMREIDRSYNFSVSSNSQATCHYVREEAKEEVGKREYEVEERKMAYH